VAAEFLAASVAVEALARHLPGEDLALARSWLKAVAQSIVELSGSAPRREVGVRLRVVSMDGAGRWDVSPVDTGQRDLGVRTDPNVRRMRHNRGHL
jgi:hypothetical protein